MTLIVLGLSLLTLGSVISTLAENTAKGKRFVDRLKAFSHI